MTTSILALLFIISGVFYISQNKKENALSWSIGWITFANVIFIGLVPALSYDSLETWFTSIYGAAAILALVSFGLGYFILKKNLQLLSWIALVLPAIFFVAAAPENQDKISSFTYVQIVGLGAVFPLMVHFLSIFISNLPAPSILPIKQHKQLISLLLGLTILAFLIIVSNFVFGKQAIYLLATGIFSTSILFTAYNLNGQKSLPSFVFLLLSITLFSYFFDAYREDMNMGMYQLFSGLIFGVVALFLSALCSSWASETQGFFSKILFLKSILGPVIFIFLSGFLFFVYEAFGGRLSLSFSILGAAIALPLLNQIFENRAYGAMSIVLGLSLLLMPMIEHDRSGAEVVIQTDQLDYDLSKLQYVDSNGEVIQTDLNDLAQASGDWTLDEDNSIIEFKVHGDESITDGVFRGFSGALKIGDVYSETSMEIEIPIAAISTYNKTRDKNIRKDDIFFDEEKFPVIRYVVSGIQMFDESYQAVGDFIMKGITAPVETNFIFAAKGILEGREVVILEGSGALNRTKFGQSSDASIGDEVSFTFKAIFVKDEN